MPFKTSPLCCYEQDTVYHSATCSCHLCEYGMCEEKPIWLSLDTFSKPPHKSKWIRNLPWQFLKKISALNGLMAGISHCWQWFIQSRIPSNTTFLLVPWLQCLCLMWAMLCSFTRITDHRHHWWDVLAGFILGAIMAVFTVSFSDHSFREC